jgi:hypothetical protein
MSVSHASAVQAGEALRQQIYEQAAARQQRLLASLHAVPADLLGAISKLPPTVRSPTILPYHFQISIGDEPATMFAFIADTDSLASILAWIVDHAELVEEAKISEVGESISLRWPTLQLFLCRLVSVQVNPLLDAIKKLSAARRP